MQWKPSEGLGKGERSDLGYAKVAVAPVGVWMGGKQGQERYVLCS